MRNAYYKIRYSQLGKRKQFSALLNVERFGSLEAAAHELLRDAGPYEIVDIRRASQGRSQEGIGNPKRYA